MKRETDAEIRQSMGKTSIAFFDIENMTPATKVLYMLGFFGLMGLVAFLGYKELIEKEPDFNTVRREMVNMKKEQKKNSKGKKKNE